MVDLEAPLYTTIFMTVKHESSKIPLEHMFNSHENCSVEWCFKTRASEEGKTYNEKDGKFRCKKNDNKLYNLLKKTILLFQKDNISKRVTAYV